MADQDRTETDSLIEQIKNEPWRFDFFQAMRLLECFYHDKPRIGKSKQLKDDLPVRFGQAVSLDFPATALASWEKGWKKRRTETGRPAEEDDRFPDRLNVRFFGLFGPNGPLPLHLTEYVLDRLGKNDPAFARFADVFHHRMLCLFYRAWAEAQPTVHYDRYRESRAANTFNRPLPLGEGLSEGTVWRKHLVPKLELGNQERRRLRHDGYGQEEDRFSRYLGSLFGLGFDSLRDRDDMPDRAKLLFAGHLSCQTRHAEGLRIIVSEFFGVAARIKEFVGEWMDIAPYEQTRLGLHEQAGHLGISTVLGARVYDCQHKISVILGPLDISFYRYMLPGQYGLKELNALLRNYIGDELAWDVNLVLRQTDVPALRLGGEIQLGFTTWLGEKKCDADDLTLALLFESPSPFGTMSLS